MKKEHKSELFETDNNEKSIKTILCEVMILLCPLFIIALVITGIVGFYSYNYKVVNTEYLEDNSAVVTKCTLGRRSYSQIELSTKYGKQVVRSNGYYEIYKDKVGSKVDVKLNKLTYKNGSTDIEVYKISDLG